MAHTACLVCFISTINGRSKKSLLRLALVAAPTNLKQSILETFNIYGVMPPKVAKVSKARVQLQCVIADILAVNFANVNAALL
jgi:hypothetical protein